MKKDKKALRTKHRHVDFIDKQLEIEFVGGVVSSREIMEQIHVQFDSNVLTSDRIKWIYDKSVELYTNFNVIIDTKSFHNLLDMESKKRKMYIALWKKIRKYSKEATLPGTITAMEKLKAYYDGRNIEIGMKGVLTHLAVAIDGDISAIEKARDELIATTDLISSKDVATVQLEPLDDYEEFKKEHKKIQKNPELIRGIYTGIPQIDNQMLGLRKGEFALICGPTESGKSILLLDIATHCWQYFGSVVVITIEMSAKQYRNRFYCRLSGIDYKRFRGYGLDKDDFKYLDKTIKKANKNPNEFIIIDMPKGCSVLEIKGRLQPILKQKQVSLAVIDYMNIICDSSGNIGFNWETQLSNAVDLKQEIARGLNLPTWSACQVSGDDSTAFSKHIPDQLDAGLHLKPDDDSKQTGNILIEWIKAREFYGKPFVITTDRNRMRFSQLPESQNKEIRKLKRLKSNKKRLNI